jgi:hypothetical protein
MATNTPDTKDKSTDSPAPEVLHSQSDGGSSASAVAAAEKIKARARLRRGTYRPSHKATFIGLGVVVGILAINVVIIMFVFNSQNKSTTGTTQSEVTISPEVLDKLGVSRNAVGTVGAELVVGPNARFNGKITVASDVSIAGQLKLNSKFIATDASLTKLEAGDTSLGQLNINGDGTVTNLNIRKDISVVGATRLQGPVTISQLVTINSGLNVAGNLALGGTLSVRGLQASSLTSDTTLTIGGHIITRGSAPGVFRGSAVGTNGSVSISGNDASGTVAVNTGTGAGGGILAQVTFRSQYGTTPHVVVSAVGAGIGSVYVSRTIGGFSIGVDAALAPGGYAFDYIVMQ